MGAEQWRKAAERAQPQLPVNLIDVALSIVARGKRAKEMLEAFIESAEGRDAMKLLAATHARIPLGKVLVGHPFAIKKNFCHYYLDAKGFGSCADEDYKITVARGSHNEEVVVQAGDRREHAKNVAEDLCGNFSLGIKENTRFTPEELMAHIRGELDKLAEQTLASAKQK